MRFYSNRVFKRPVARIQPCLSWQSALNVHCLSWVVSSFPLGILLLNLKNLLFIKTGLLSHKNLLVLSNKSFFYSSSDFSRYVLIRRMVYLECWLTFFSASWHLDTTPAAKCHWEILTQFIRSQEKTGYKLPFFQLGRWPVSFHEAAEPDECHHFLLFCDKCVGQWSQTFQRLVSPTVRPPDCSVEAFYIWTTFCANSSLLLHKMHHRHLAHEQHLCSVTLNFTSYRCTLWLENVNQQSAQSLFSHQILKNVIPIGTRKEKWYCLLLHVQFPLLKLSQLLG